jgi:biopolymer transport protein ExbD
VKAGLAAWSGAKTEGRMIPRRPEAVTSTRHRPPRESGLLPGIPPIAAPAKAAGGFFFAARTVAFRHKFATGLSRTPGTIAPFADRHPAMHTWGDTKPRKSRIEIIPMIDVMMFLLVFFVLVSINVIPALGLKTTLPKSSQAQENKARRNAVITLGKTGELQLDGKPTTIIELPGKLRALQRPEEKLFVVINGDQATELQLLIDVMDALKAAGFEAFSIASKKK